MLDLNKKRSTHQPEELILIHFYSLLLKDALEPHPIAIH